MSTHRIDGFRIDVRRREDVPRLVADAALARGVAAALTAAGAPVPATIGVTLTGDPELAELNATHMGASGPTDVLSFPLLPADAFPAHPGKATAAGAAAPTFVLPPRRWIELGDVVVSVERAIAQAADGHGGQTGDVRWTAAEELRLLVTHGALHVCGWDHADPVEEAAMRALERELLAGDDR